MNISTMRSSLLALASLACSETQAPAAPIRSSEVSPIGGRPSIVRPGPGFDASVEAGAQGTACPFAGRYRLTQRDLEATSDPRCVLGPDALSRVFLSPVTQEHRISLAGRACTLRADEVSDDACTQRRLVVCDDGTSSETRCEASMAAGDVRCVAVNDDLTLRCSVISDYISDPAWEGKCDAINGPYTRTSVLLEGGSDCQDLPVTEIADPVELALDPLCTFALADSSGSCALAAVENCEGGIGATHTCSVSHDSSAVTCQVQLGECSYQVDLVR